MDQNTLLVIFVGISAVALVIQAGMLYGTYKASRAVQESIVPLVPKIEALVVSSRAAIDENRVKVAEITAKANEILDTVHRQMKNVEGILNDASSKTRRQLDHAEVIMDDAMDRAEETVAAVHQGIMKPLRGINGVLAGVRVALQFLMQGGRPNPDRVTADEEMFI